MQPVPIKRKEKVLLQPYQIENKLSEWRKKRKKKEKASLQPRISSSALPKQFFSSTQVPKKKFHHSIIIKNIKMKEEGVSDPSLSQEILQNKRSAVMPACVKVSPAVASFR
jgi:hypothetical protein